MKHHKCGTLLGHYKRKIDFSKGLENTISILSQIWAEPLFLRYTHRNIDVEIEYLTISNIQVKKKALPVSSCFLSLCHP